MEGNRNVAAVNFLLFVFTRSPRAILSVCPAGINKSNVRVWEARAPERYINGNHCATTAANHSF